MKIQKRNTLASTITMFIYMVVFIVLLFSLSGCDFGFGKGVEAKWTAMIRDIFQINNSTGSQKLIDLGDNDNNQIVHTDTVTINSKIKMASENNLSMVGVSTLSVIVNVLEKFSPKSVVSVEHGDMVMTKNNNITIPSNCRMIETEVIWPNGKIERKKVVEPINKTEQKSTKMPVMFITIIIIIALLDVLLIIGFIKYNKR